MPSPLFSSLCTIVAPATSSLQYTTATLWRQRRTGRICRRTAGIGRSGQVAAVSSWRQCGMISGKRPRFVRCLWGGTGLHNSSTLPPGPASVLFHRHLEQGQGLLVEWGDCLPCHRPGAGRDRRLWDSENGFNVCTSLLRKGRSCSRQ